MLGKELSDGLHSERSIGKGTSENSPEKQVMDGQGVARVVH